MELIESSGHVERAHKGGNRISHQSERCSAAAAYGPPSAGADTDNERYKERNMHLLNLHPGPFRPK